VKESGASEKRSVLYGIPYRAINGAYFTETHEARMRHESEQVDDWSLNFLIYLAKEKRRDAVAQAHGRMILSRFIEALKEDMRRLAHSIVRRYG